MLSNSTGVDGSSQHQANFILPDINKLALEAKSGSLAILLVSFGMHFYVKIDWCWLVLGVCHFNNQAHYTISLQWVHKIHSVESICPRVLWIWRPSLVRQTLSSDMMFSHKLLAILRFKSVTALTFFCNLVFFS